VTILGERLQEPRKRLTTLVDRNDRDDENERKTRTLVRGADSVRSYDSYTCERANGAREREGKKPNLKNPNAASSRDSQGLRAVDWEEGSSSCPS